MKMAHILTLATLLSGCANNTAGIVLSGMPAHGAVLTQHQSLNVNVQELSRRKHQGLQQVIVSLANDQDTDNHLQYLFNWYDDAGQELASEGQSYTPITLHGYQTRTISGLAPSPLARSYRLSVREVFKESY